MKCMSRIAELLEDWLFWVRRHGGLPAMRAVAGDLARLPYRRIRYIVHGRSLLEPFPDFKPKIPLEIRPFERSDAKFIRQMDRPSEARLCTARLAYGQKGVLALHGSVPVGHAWSCIKVERALERVHLPLRHGDVLFSDAYTAPAFRGRGVQRAMMLARMRLFREMGYRRAINYVDRRNAPSLAASRKLGWRVVGHIDFFRIGPWRWSRYKHINASAGRLVNFAAKNAHRQQLSSHEGS